MYYNNDYIIVPEYLSQKLPLDLTMQKALSWQLLLVTLVMTTMKKKAAMMNIVSVLIL